MHRSSYFQAKVILKQVEIYEVLTKRRRGMKLKVVVCHVLRYSPFFTTLKDLILSGKIGEVISITHEECVGNIHQSHSFVRGNWGNTERLSMILLQKSCHDLDILQWLIGKKCIKVQSFGMVMVAVMKELSFLGMNI